MIGFGAFILTTSFILPLGLTTAYPLGPSRLCSKVEKTEDISERHKRYVTNEYKWLFTDLTWQFRDPFNLFKDLNDYERVKSIISRALSMWSAASNESLKFEELNGEWGSERAANMDLLFARFDHGDTEPFDGRGGIVAHSGYPMHGTVHFDASELWTLTGRRGIDLRYVTLHEIGHALGLRHSEKDGAIMHPIYRRKDSDSLALTDDDIRGIRALYLGNSRAANKFNQKVQKIKP